MYRDKSHNRTERESQGVGRDILIPKKLFLELYVDHAKAVSGELVDFRKTPFNEGASTNLKKRRHKWRDDVELIN